MRLGIRGWRRVGLGICKVGGVAQRATKFWPRSSPCEIHAGQMWAGSGPTLLAVWVDLDPTSPPGSCVLQ